MATKLVGQNYTTPDLVAKVTGKAKYSEDHRAEGMLFAKLLLSPMPHARVVSIDTSAALAMPGVKAILTPDDLPGAQAGQLLGEGVVSTAQGERPLTNEPVYEGEPILAVAAVDEYTAAEAIEAIQVRIRTAALRRRYADQSPSGWSERAAAGQHVARARATGCRRGSWRRSCGRRCSWSGARGGCARGGRRSGCTGCTGCTRCTGCTGCGTRCGRRTRCARR